MRRAAFAVLLPVLATVTLLTPAAPAFAQVPPPRPLAPAVIDVRGIYAGLGQDVLTASDLGVDAAVLPTRGLGVVAGLQVYPIRRSGFAIGLGGDVIFVRARSNGTGVDEDGQPAGPDIERFLGGYTGSLSLNFGGRDGWSYLSAGIGPMRFDTFVDPRPSDTPTSLTQHFGGGARWFSTDHLAFAVDVRFYLTRPQLAIGALPGRDRWRIFVVSVGISVH